MRKSFYCLLFGTIAVTALSGDKPDPRLALDSEFPDPAGVTKFAGEITLVEHVNRRGILRLDRDGTINKYYWDLPHHFQMLPYGAIYFRGAPAELRDIPIGTHLHGDFYLGPEGDFEVTPPVSGYAAGKMARPDLRSVESKYSRVLRLEDDFSFYERQGIGWKIKSVSDSPHQIIVSQVMLKDESSVPGEEEQVFRIDEGTRVWKGAGYGGLSDLADGQVVQLNLGWVTLLGSKQQDGLCRDIWIDQESRAVATKHQEGIQIAHLKRRGIGAKVIKTESTPGKGAEGHVTIELHKGTASSLLEEISQAKSIFVRVAEPTLRIYDINDLKYGRPVEVTLNESPPPGSSGIQIRFHIYEMLEGLRPGRTVRVGLKDWDIPVTPREEKLQPNDLRIFEVGPKHIVDRDGPPEGVDK